MNEEFEVAKAELHSAEEVADIIKNPIAKNMFLAVQKIPKVGEFVSSSAEYLLENFLNGKEKNLNEIILRDNHTITSDMVNDIEFIVNYSRTIDTVRRLATNDKIQFFGNLIRNGYLSGDHIENDEFEEYLEVLATLSYRQLECLAEFYQKSRLTNGRIIDEDWELFKKNSKYSETDINFIFKQLMRTGFINEYRDVISTSGSDIEEELTFDMEGACRGYELDESFMKFYDMVLKMEE